MRSAAAADSSGLASAWLPPLVLVVDPRTNGPALLPYSTALGSLWRFLRPRPA